MAHTKTPEETEKLCKTSKENGLSEKEAKKRLSAYGANKLKDEKKHGILLLFFEQFNDFLIIILIAAACISFFTNILEGSGDIAEPIVILSIVVLNAMLGVIQERRAEKSLAALKKMTAPKASVIRSSTEITIDSENVCVGDVLVLRAGDITAADVRLFETVNLEVDESALTGESVPVQKNALQTADEHTPLAERVNMAYSGTYVTGGYAKGIVVAVGMNTEVGQIAEMISAEEDSPTPLQKKLEEIGRILGVCALGICAAVFVIGVFHKLAPFDMFVTSVSLAVAAIPEGLPAIVTIMLSLGVQKMARCGAIVRNLPAVEALGGADVICTDKTGTLTQNKMTVQSVWGDEQSTVKYSLLCCGENTKNPTELALIKYAQETGASLSDEKRTAEFPFSSDSKQMRVMYGKLLTVKGAPEIIAGQCSFFQSGNKCERMTDLKRSAVAAQNKRFAKGAMRVIAVAYKSDASTIDDGGLVFCGLVAMSDPPRPDAVEAVRLCKKAGIKPVMITGDHVETACAIAKEAGIDTGGGCISGRELNKLTQAEFEKKILSYSVFARATPEHKVKIVKALQKKGMVVAMTGDGVNDAPALKAADIGCSLGLSGTDVAKASSDIVLTDDNFATIVKSVRLGREIYENIRKSVKFLISSNIGEIVTVFVAILLGLPTPLLAMQLLWINLVTDSLPAIALGVDPCDGDMLENGKNNGSLFTPSMTISIILEGMMIGALSLLAFSIGINVCGSLSVGRTMSFCVLGLSQLIHAFNMRSENSVLGRAFFKNKLLILSFLVGSALQIGVVFFFPQLFGVTMLSINNWIAVATLSIVPLAVVELQKKLYNIKKPRI